VIEDIKDVLDWTAVSAALATFFGMLPDIAALLSVIWLAIRLWETKTVQKLLKGMK